MRTVKIVLHNVIEFIPRSTDLGQHYWADYPSATWKRHLRDEDYIEMTVNRVWGQI